jgi:hypothetical protein
VELFPEDVVAGRFMRCCPGKNNNTTSAAAPAPAIHIGRTALTAGASLAVAVPHIACAALTTGASLPDTAIHTGWAALTAGASLADAVMHIGRAALSIATNFADEALYVGLTSPTILISVADTAIHTNAKDLRSRGASQKFASSSVSPTISNLRAQPVFSEVRCGAVWASGDGAWLKFGDAVKALATWAGAAIFAALISGPAEPAASEPRTWSAGKIKVPLRSTVLVRK